MVRDSRQGGAVLSASGMQWAVNAYLLTLAALFAFGGRLADTAGHRRMVVLGVIVFAGASALCGATIMAVAALVALRGLRRGVQEDTARTAEEFSSQLPGEDPRAGLDPAWR